MSSTATWTRVFKGGAHSNAVNRTVDESAVLKFLNERTAAKASKNYAKADEIASALQRMDICYLDETMEWYTRSPKSPKRKNKEMDAGNEEAPAAKKKKQNVTSSANVVTTEQGKKGVFWDSDSSDGTFDELDDIDGAAALKACGIILK